MKEYSPRYDAKSVRSFFDDRNDIEIERVYYCYQLGSTFVTLNSMKHSLIILLTMTKWGSIKKIEEVEGIDRVIRKRATFLENTLGNLIQVLKKSGFDDHSINYLKWIKEKIDYFVHRFFHEGAWPGDMDSENIDILCRRLRYLEMIFMRAQNRILLMMNNEDFDQKIHAPEWRDDPF